MVSEFRAAVNKKTPPRPTYRTTWDITVLLRKVETLGENESMALELLLLKVVVLLRIDCFARSSDITRIFRKMLFFRTIGWSFISYGQRNGEPRRRTRGGNSQLQSLFLS